MGMSALSVVMGILVLYIHHHSVRHRPPRWVRIIFFRWIARILFMKKNVPVVSNTEIEETSAELNTVVEEDKNGFLRPKSRMQRRSTIVSYNNSKKENIDTAQIEKLITLLTKMVDKMDEKENDDAVYEEWAALARVVDRILFWLSLLYMIIVISYSFGATT